MEPSADLSEQLINLGLNTDVLYILNCLAIIIRSIHNCRVFCYYGGMQKIIALLKGNLML